MPKTLFVFFVLSNTLIIPPFRRLLSQENPPLLPPSFILPQQLTPWKIQDGSFFPIPHGKGD